MDFRERGVDFEEVDRRYAQLKRLHEAGEITEEEFDEQLKRSMVQDQGGRWWSKSRKSGEWHYNDGNAWVPGTPPHRQQSISGHKRGRPDVQHDYVQHDYAPEPTVRSTEVRAKVWLGLGIACAVITLPGFTILLATFLDLLARPALEDGPLLGGGIILIVFLQLVVGSLGVLFSLLAIRAGRPMGKHTSTINGMGLLTALLVLLVVFVQNTSSENTSSENTSSEKASSEKASSDPDSEDKNSSELSRIVNEAKRMKSDLPGKTISEAGPIAGGDYKLEVLQVESSTQLKGTIISTSGPTTSDPNSVTITLSGGQESVKVPDVSGLSALQAGKVLLDAGLEPNVTVYFDQSGNAVTATRSGDDDEQKDVSTTKITGTYEEAGSVVQAGTTILLQALSSETGREGTL
jgi:beta-lactam-binding protein with PASTA domain